MPPLNEICEERTGYHGRNIGRHLASHESTFAFLVTTMAASNFIHKGLAMIHMIRLLCFTFSAAFFAASLTGCNNAALTKDGFPIVNHMIDTHIHLYDTTRPGGVPWPYPDNKVLYKPHAPEEFNAVAKPTGVTGVVIVEASHLLEDNQMMLDWVKGDDFYVGLVGNVDLYSETFAKDLAELAKDRRYVGIRARRKGDLNFTDPIVVKNLKELSRQNLTLDMLINGKGATGVDDVDTVAKQVPELTIVVNHLCGYNVDNKPLNADWLASVQRVAKHPNVYCKVSGLFQRARPQPATKNIEHYRSLLDALWNNFGNKRLIYGSNWPVTKQSGDYASYVRLVASYFAEKGQDACENYYWRNAVRAYRLPLK